MEGKRGAVLETVGMRCRPVVEINHRGRGVGLFSVSTETASFEILVVLVVAAVLYQQVPGNHNPEIGSFERAFLLVTETECLRGWWCE